jgi:hypothetical protein
MKFIRKLVPRNSFREYLSGILCIGGISLLAATFINNQTTLATPTKPVSVKSNPVSQVPTETQQAQLPQPKLTPVKTIPSSASPSSSPTNNCPSIKSNLEDILNAQSNALFNLYNQDLASVQAGYAASQNTTSENEIVQEDNTSLYQQNQQLLNAYTSAAEGYALQSGCSDFLPSPKSLNSFIPDF